MNRLQYLLLLLIVPTYMQMPAWAQVQRCTDASGHVTYTNAPCTQGQRSQEVVPPLSPQERAQQEAQYQQALAQRREAQALQLQRDAALQAQQQAEAAARAAERRQQPVVVELAPPAPSVAYGPLYPPPRPPHHVAPPPRPEPPSRAGQQCNVFRCYDGKGKTWSRP